MAGRFEIYATKKGKFRFHLKASNGEVIASSEKYVTKVSARKGIASIQVNAATAEVVDLTVPEKVVLIRKASAKKAPAKKAPAKKAPTTKAAPAKKAPAKKAPAKKAPAKKAPATKAAPVKKAPAKKTAPATTAPATTA